MAGGRAACQALFDELMVQAQSDMHYAGAYLFALESYCMQHVEKYGVSSKSYAAHLMGLCCAAEHGNDPGVRAAIQRWLNGAVRLTRPVSLDARGSITVVDVRAARSPEEHADLARAWAADVWQAYASQHDLARSWLQAAVDAPKTRPRS